MTCLFVRRLLSAYIDSELLPDQMLELRNHLFRCPECSSEHDELIGAKGSLSALSATEPSNDLLKLIACRPWETGDDSVRGESRPSGVLSIRKRYIPAVAAVLVLAASIGVGLSTTGPSRVAPPVSLAESFRAEHQRFRYASPLSGSPDTLELGQLSDVPKTLGEVAGVTVSYSSEGASE